MLVVDAPGVLKTVPGVFRELLAREADLVLSGRYYGTDGPEGLPADLAADPAVTWANLSLARDDDSAAAVTAFRAASTMLWASSPALKQASMPRARTFRRYRKALFKLLERERGEAAAELNELDSLGRMEAHPLAHEAFAALARRLERLLPPPPGLVAEIEAIAPDVVFILSRCSHGGVEPDVIKAARAAGVPSVLLVWSWDNLSSKAVLNEHPDTLLVWNERQAREAVELHAVAAPTVVPVGAPNFDRFFAELEAIPRVGEQEGILYLGSSPNIAPDEPVIFRAWVEALRRHPALRARPVVVRPHPGKEARWTGTVDDLEGVTLSMPGVGATLAELLVSCEAVVALNTSAEIEAAIAGRPVLTFRAGPDAPGQEGSLHFEYLLRANGGFVIDAPDLAAHLDALARVLADRDDGAVRERFVREFVRLRGIDVPVAGLVADEVLARARA